MLSVLSGACPDVYDEENWPKKFDTLGTATNVSIAIVFIITMKKIVT